MFFVYLSGGMKVIRPDLDCTQIGPVLPLSTPMVEHPAL